MTHIVRPGETLGDIAAQYGTTVVAIMRLNGIRNPNLLYAGQAVRIPRDAAYQMAQHSGPTVPLGPHTHGYGAYGQPPYPGMMGHPDYTYPQAPMPGGPMPGSSMPGGPMPGSQMPGGPMPGSQMPGGPMPGSPMPGGSMPGSPMGTMADPYGTHAAGMHTASVVPYGPHEHNPHTARLNQHQQRLDDLETRVAHLEARVRHMLH